MPKVDVLPDAHGSPAFSAAVAALVAETKRDAEEARQTQIDKFRDLARQLEADEDPEAFKEKVRKVARAPKPPAKERD